MRRAWRARCARRRPAPPRSASTARCPASPTRTTPHARLIVLWGVNPSASGIHLVPYVREAQRKGATLIVVDPRRTALAKQADLHLALRPGTDLPVALALHRFLFENGLADEAFLARSRDRRRRAARRRRAVDDRARRGRRRPRAGDARAVRPTSTPTATPALIRCGWGLERNRNGGHAAMAVLGAPGRRRQVRRARRRLHDEQLGAWHLNNRDWIGVDAPATRVVNMNVLGEALPDAARSDDRGAVRLQRQPGRDHPGSERGAAAASSARICSRSCSSRS